MTYAEEQRMKRSTYLLALAERKWREREMNKRLDAIAPLQWFRVSSDSEHPIGITLAGVHHFKTRAEWCEIHAELTQILEHVIKKEEAK